MNEVERGNLFTVVLTVPSNISARLKRKCVQVYSYVDLMMENLCLLSTVMCFLKVRTFQH